MKQGKNPLQIDSPKPKKNVEEYLQMENRFKMLAKAKPEVAKRLFEKAQENVNAQRELYEYLAAKPISNDAAAILDEKQPATTV